MICERCGHVGQPKSKTDGSFLVEGCLWLFFLLPGLIYSIWRLSTRRKTCPVCDGAMIPLNSPRGQLLQQQLHNKQP